MGVHGLWTIVSPVARPVKLESLHGRRLAVDASIWIYHFLKAVRDKNGNALPNAHIVGFFRRVCKLLYYGILPVFVFDGDAPMIKKQTIAGRKKRREGREEDSTRTANKILSLQMQKLAEQELQGTTNDVVVDGQRAVYFDELNMSDKEREKRRADAATSGNSMKKFRKQDPYHLPDQELAVAADDPRLMSEADLEKYAQEFQSAEDIGLYDTTNIDFSSAEFAALPMTVQYQLLNTARLRSRLRMGYSKEQLDQIFPDRLEFSKFQVARVKERNMLTQKLLGLNGLAEDLSMRVAGEKDKEYLLKKNENGWTLALEDADSSQLIKIDEEEEHEEDVWEEVDLPSKSQSSFKTALPRPDMLTRGSFILPGIYENSASSQELHTTSSDKEALPLFAIPEDDEDEYKDDDLEESFAELVAQEDGQQMQLAISRSLDDQTRTASEDLSSHAPAFNAMTIDVIDDISSDDEKESSHEYQSSRGTDLLMWDTGDLELDKIIKNLPKLPDTEQTQIESKSEEPFIHSSFNMKSSIFGRKRRLATNFDESSAASASQKVPKLVMECDNISLLRSSAEQSPVDGDLNASPSFASNSLLETKQPPKVSDAVPAVVEAFESPISANFDTFESNLIANIDQDDKQDLNAKLISLDSSKEVKVENIADDEDWEPVSLVVRPKPEIMDRAQSPDWNLSELKEEKEQQMGEHSQLVDDYEAEVPVRLDAASSLELGNRNAELEEGAEDQADPDDEPPIDYEEQEDEELVNNLAREVQEHERFAMQINNNRPSQVSRINYDEEIRALQAQQRLDRRDADNVTIAMVQECQELLSRFGIPYITAPMEAEAQCAELLELGLVDGVITDDSDIFLFGASRVYKNMFNQAKFVECYRVEDLKKDLALDRLRLIELAHLLGSDYTAGIPGVGPVTAMQLIKDFSGERPLEEFKEWYERIQKGDTNVDITTPFRKKFKKKSKKLFLRPEFPDKTVDEAYLKPTVDRDDTQFVWGTPDLDRIRSFLMSTIGWTKERADEVLVPLIRTMNLKRQALQFSRHIQRQM
ncbi:uncharacterized protein V1516DRAFT_651270 [Lipomyces oligophaga]|uniref:uncharacterized protein n=1 Tax=Lipomyces oligophaga TaxID=45792 RepID=UPI0034D01A20